MGPPSAPPAALFDMGVEETSTVRGTRVKPSADNSTSAPPPPPASKKALIRPFPWCLTPDWFWLGFGAVEVLFVSVPLFAMILSTEASWWLLAKIYDTALRKPIDAVWNGIHKVAQKAGDKMLLDTRNWSYLPMMFFHSVVIPIFFYLAWCRHRSHGFEVTSCLLYHFMRIGPRFRWFTYHHVLIHKEGHDKKGFFKPQYWFLNSINQFWCGFFYGQVPNSYAVAHNKVHHRWHNDTDDVHTNLDLDRTDPISYLIYLPRFTFYWTNFTPLLIFLKRREWVYARGVFEGMVLYYGVMALLWYHDWTFCIGYYVLPQLEAITFLGAISYLWHAFVDPKDPTNQYVNSMTILNGKDNVWNEDYHVVHHHAPGVHWTEMPAHYQKNIHHYARSQATIFRDTEEGQLLFFMFTCRWDEMARHFVDLNGKLTHEEKKALILERMSVVLDHTGRTGAAEWGNSEQRDWDDTEPQ